MPSCEVGRGVDLGRDVALQEPSQACGTGHLLGDTGGTGPSIPTDHVRVGNVASPSGLGISHGQMELP